MLRPSDLRRRVVLQQRSAAQDTFGERLHVWTDYLAGLTVGAAKSITGVTVGATTLLQCAAHGWREGQLVRLAGITGFPGLPCTYAVIAPSANAFSVQLDSRDLTLTLASASATPMSGVPASIEPLRGRETVNDSEVSAELTYSIGMRFHHLLIDPIRVADLRAVHWHGAVRRVFNLSPAVNADSRNRFVMIQASEGLTEG